MKRPEISSSWQNKIRILITGICLLFVQFASAQFQKGDVMLTGGASLVQGMNFIADISVNSKISFGIGYTHTRFTPVVTRDNFAARTLFHFENDLNWDFYLGVRLGISYWSTTGTQSSYPYLSLVDRVFGYQYGSAQFVIGGRYLINPCFGVNAELAIGFPYIASAGICININNSVKAMRRKKDPASPEPASQN